jgi:hypothetical protein
MIVSTRPPIRIAANRKKPTMMRVGDECYLFNGEWMGIEETDAGWTARDPWTDRSAAPHSAR